MFDAGLVLQLLSSALSEQASTGQHPLDVRSTRSRATSEINMACMATFFEFSVAARQDVNTFYQNGIRLRGVPLDLQPRRSYKHALKPV